MNYKLLRKAPRRRTLPAGQIFRRLIGYVWPYKHIFILGFICAFVASMTDWMFAALIKPLTDQGFSGKAAQQFWIYPAAIVGIFIVRGVFTFANSYAMSYISQRLLATLRGKLFDKLITLPTHYFDDHPSSYLVSRMIFEVNSALNGITSVLTNLIRSGCTIAGLLGWLFYMNWRLASFALVFLPLMTLVVRRLSRRMRRLSRQSIEMTEELTRVVQETITCQKIVKIYGGQNTARGFFTRTQDKLRGFAMRITVASSVTVPITQFFAACAVAGVIWYALTQIQSGGMTPGEFISFLVAMLMLLPPLKQLAEISGSFERSLAAAEGVFELLDTEPEDDSGSRTVERVSGRIEFKGVGLCYPGAARFALKDIDLQIRAGENIALVGASGSGKTSLVNLIPRFYHATTGRILIDDIPIEDLTLASLRGQIAMVGQDVVLFNDTIGANIGYGARGKPDEAAIREAARAAHLLEFIESLPMGLDTMIGENGVRLSGGQRQRLAIARAVLKDAPILILDEATSALDSESERHVQEALDELMQNRTTVVIAHRLSTIEKADRIIVLEDGRIAESGTHAELLARAGVYANLHRIQYVRQESED